MLATKNTREYTTLLWQAQKGDPNVDASNIEEFENRILKSGEKALAEISENLLNLSDASQRAYLHELMVDIKAIADAIVFNNENYEKLADEYGFPPPTVHIDKEAEEALSEVDIVDRRHYRIRAILEEASITTETCATFDKYDWIAYQQYSASLLLSHFWWYFRPHALRRGINLPVEVWELQTTNEPEDIGAPKKSPVQLPPSAELLPPLIWKGTGVELAALFVELAAKGYIQLPGPNNFIRTPWEKICRAILRLFVIKSQRSDATGEPWYNFSRYFVSRAENEKLVS